MLAIYRLSKTRVHRIQIIFNFFNISLNNQIHYTRLHMHRQQIQCLKIIFTFFFFKRKLNLVDIFLRFIHIAGSSNRIIPSLTV